MSNTKPYKGPNMEGPIATWYARITKRDRGYAHIADDIAARLPRGARVLEVAPGPGYLAVELARRGLAVAAVDISASFVAMVQANAREAGVTIDVRHGDAAALPFGDGEFAYVVCRAAFKNFSDPLGALNECYRVLAPDGIASILDLRKDATPDEIRAEIDAMQMSWPSRVCTRWTFRAFLLPRAYTTDAIARLATQSRFGHGDVRRDGIGFELRLVRPAAAPMA